MNDYIGIKIVACHQNSMRAQAERERIAGAGLRSVRIGRWAVGAVRAGWSAMAQRPEAAPCVGGEAVSAGRIGA